MNELMATDSAVRLGRVFSLALRQPIQHELFLFESWLLLVLGQTIDVSQIGEQHVQSSDLLLRVTKEFAATFCAFPVLGLVQVTE